MTPEEAARLEELCEEFRRGLAEDGGVWPVYTGGRRMTRGQGT
jgi:hypothetical protein